MEDLNIGEMGSPDSLASTGPSDEVTLVPDSSATIPDGTEDTSSDEIISDTDEDAEEDSPDEISSLTTEAPDDTPLVKKLRGLLKTRVESSQVPSISESQQEAINLVNELYSFDPDKGQPTTVGFAKKLVEKDVNLASQVLSDLTSIEISDNGWTLGHQLLKNIGLDPYKLDELRQFSRGEIQLGDTPTEIPDIVPKEFHDAYKALSKVLRTDVEIYLSSADQNQKYAALELLKDRQDKIEAQRANEKWEAENQSRFNSEVMTEIEGKLEVLYTGILGSIKENPAYKSVAVSSNPVVDQTVKDSIIARINALGDPRSVLAKESAQAFESIGVKVDTAKVHDLMTTIEKNTEIIVKADKLGKLQRRDYSVQIQEAQKRVAEAQGQALALANKYFSQALAKISKGPGAANPEIPGAPPILSGDSPGGPKARGVLSPNDLDKMVEEVSKSIRAGA